MNHPLPFPATEQLWRELQWQKISPTLTTRKNHPLAFADAPKGGGLYRIALADALWWSEHSAKRITLKACARITDPWLDTALWSHPMVLTMGKSSQVRTRLEQHFGSNANNNRLIRRLGDLFPGLSPDEIRGKALTGLEIDVAECADWRHRVLLERYGSALHQPLCDFDAEH